MERRRDNKVTLVRDVPKLTLRINEPIVPSVFQLKFTPNTVITHERTLQHGVVRKDHSIRPVTDEEMKTPGFSWVKAMETDPPPGTPPFAAKNDYGSAE